MEIDDQETGSLVGDATRGKRLFQEHPVASCVRCHQVQGQGCGGPSWMTLPNARMPPDPQSLIDPQAAIAEGYPYSHPCLLWRLTATADVEDLIAYLMTYKPIPLRVHAWLLKPFSLSRDAEGMGRLVGVATKQELSLIG